MPASHRPPEVVFLCQRVPWPPDRGDRITTWHFLQHLLARGATVRLGCFQEEDRDAAAVEFLASRCREVVAPRLSRRLRRLLCLRGLLTGEPLTLPFFRHAGLRRAVARWTATPPDLVHVYSSSMAQYAMGLPARACIVQFAELDSDKWRQYAVASSAFGRWIYGREARRLLAFETRVAHACTRALVVSDVERELFRACIPGADADVLPNGVDVDHFASAGDAQRQAHTAIFTGVMDYEPNVEGATRFVAECWPALRQRFHDARLLIVGSRPVRQVRALAEVPGVAVTGRVETTPPWFDRAAVAIAPLRLARGVQNKVLEALSMGVPVVASSQAVQGLGVVPPGAVDVADDPAATIAAVANRFADPNRARADGAAAATWIRQRWRWEHMYARYEAILAAAGLQLPD